MATRHLLRSLQAILLASLGFAASAAVEEKPLPKLLTTEPADNTGLTVDRGRVFYATFDQPISYQDTGTIELIDEDNPNVTRKPSMVLIANGSTTGTAIIVMDAAAGDLDPGTAYRLMIDDRSIYREDLSAAYAGTTASTWNFLASATTLVNHPPYPSRLDYPKVSSGGETTINDGNWLVTDPDGKQVTVIIIAPPTLGQLSSSSGAKLADSTISQEEITAGLSYQSNSTATRNDYFLYQLRDSDGATSPVLWYTIRNLAAGGSTAISVDPSVYTVAYREGDSGLAIFGNSVDVGNLEGDLTVTVSYRDGDRILRGGDQLTVPDTTKISAGAAGSDGVNGAALSFVIDSSANDLEVEAILESITYHSTSLAYSANQTRRLQTTITKGSAGSGTTTLHDITLTAVNNLPVYVAGSLSSGGQPLDPASGIAIDRSGGFRGRATFRDPEGLALELNLGLSDPSKIPEGTLFVDAHSYDASTGQTSFDFRYLPGSTEQDSKTIILAPSDGVESGAQDLSLRIAPFTANAPQLLSDPALTLGTLASGRHQLALTFSALPVSTQLGLRHYGDPPPNFAYTQADNVLTLEWDGGADGGMLPWGLVLIDTGGSTSVDDDVASTIPLTLVLVDPPAN